MKIYVLASGSKGNCTLVCNDEHSIIIDIGISNRKLVNKLNEVSLSLDDIDAFLFTHDHCDHISGVDKHIDRTKCYCAKGTLDDIPIINELKHYETYQIAGFKITILPTSHDAKNPIGFIIEDKHEKLTYMTDTGYISSKNLEYMENSSYYIIESNHDYKMLMNTDRPENLKKRIASDYGHLSNDDSAECISHIVGNKTRTIVLAHLSQEANTPELALITYHNTFKRNNVSLDNIKIICATQNDTLIVKE